jgi:hypothetical protein
MSKEQCKMVCDFSHDVIMKLKKMLGFKPHEVSLLCHSLAHLNSATWLERITANGVLSEYEVKH